MRHPREPDSTHVPSGLQGIVTDEIWIRSRLETAREFVSDQLGR